MIFYVRGKIQGKRRPRFARVGVGVRTYKAREDICYENSIITAFLQAKRKDPPDWDFASDALELHMTAVFAYPKNWSTKKKIEACGQDERPRKKPDADNILKQIDALNGIAFNDDAQIVKASVEKYYGADEYLCIELKAYKRGCNGTESQ